jgi:hypothetical protein
MSKIAEALAKAKERTGTTTAPFLTGRSGPPGLPPPTPGNKDALLRKARRTQLFWLVLTSVAAVITGFVLWQRLAPEKRPATAPAGAQPASSPSTAHAPTSTAPVPTPSAPAAAHVATTAPAGAQPAPAPARAIPPNAELYNTINTLVISAVLPGAQPRLMHKGRIVQVGEPIEGELVFAGLQDGQLMFTDRRGAVYLRRY